MKAVILAAGKGTRLYPLTLETPKPLISIAGKPVIERILESLPDAVSEVVIVVDHLKEKLISHIGSEFAGRSISYVSQGEMRGTFGALLSAKEYLNGEEKFLVLNGDDILSKEDLEKFLLAGRTFGVQKSIMPPYYSVIVEEGRVLGFRPQTDEEKERGALIATGTYLLDGEIFSHPGVVVYGGELGLPQTILAQMESYPIRAVETEGWIPINSLEDLQRAEEILKRL